MKKLLAMSLIGMMCITAVFAETDLLEQGSTIGFSVNEDRSGIIQNAFTSALSAAGFKIVSNNAEYLLNVNITLTPLAFSNISNAFVRIELTANLIDNNGRVLLPYAFSSREGHVNQTSAEERAFHNAVIKINAEYRNLLNDIIAAEHAQPVKQGNTIGFSVNKDRSGIIQNAFTSALSAAGLINNNNNPAYLLDVNITVTPLAMNVANTEFVRFDLIANLLDNNGRVLLPYTINLREGYVNQAGAEERAFHNAVTKINAEYGNLLNDIIFR